MVATNQDLRKVRELQLALRLSEVPSRPCLPLLLPRLVELLEAEEGLTFTVRGEEPDYTLEQLSTVGLSPERVRRQLEPLFQKEERAGLFNPARPEPSQRNRVLTRAELEAKRTGAGVPPVLQALGFERHDLLRVLVCEGPQLLAYVAVFRKSPFGPRERRLFAELLPDLKRRLWFEHEFAHARLAQAMVGLLFEQLAKPAVLVDERGRVQLANGPARRWMEAQPLTSRAELTRALEREPSHLALSEIHAPGLSPHFLLIAKEAAEGELSERSSRLASQYRLTRRQTEVFEGLLRGATNKAIARELLCAEKTIELHVSAILRKAGVRTRVELLASVAPRAHRSVA